MATKYKLFERIDNDPEGRSWQMDEGTDWLDADTVIEIMQEYKNTSYGTITINEMGIEYRVDGHILAVALNDNEEATTEDAEDYVRTYDRYDD